MSRTRQPQQFTRPAPTGLGRGMQLLLNPALGGSGILDVATGAIWTASGAMTKAVSPAGIVSVNGDTGAHYTSAGYSNITGKRGTLFMYAPSVGVTDANGHVLFGESTSAAYWQCSYNGGVPYGWGIAASGATSTWFNGTNRSIVFANDGTGFSVWINGVFIGSAASSTAIPTGSKTMRCMGWPGGSFDPVNTQFVVLGYTSETWDQRAAQSFHFNPHQVYAKSRRVWVQLGPAAGGGAVTGTATITPSPQTLTGAGTVAVAGTLNKTPAAQTVTAAATVAIAGTLNKTPAAQTVSATGTVTSGVVGTASITPAAQTVTASGTVPIAATATITPSAQTVTGAATVTGGAVTGTATITPAAQTVTASATVSGGAVTGTANVFVSAQTLVASANIIVVGTATITPAAQTLLGLEAGALPEEIPESSRTWLATTTRLGPEVIDGSTPRIGSASARRNRPRLG
jgi:hypothetical protein